MSVNYPNIRNLIATSFHDTPMGQGTRRAVESILTETAAAHWLDYHLGAMELINAARHLVDASNQITDGNKAILDDALDGLYLTIKSEWKAAA